LSSVRNRDTGTPITQPLAGSYAKTTPTICPRLLKIGPPEFPPMTLPLISMTLPLASKLGFST
jgi:hypothetical protein